MLIQTVLLTGAGLLLAPLAVLYGDVERLMRIVMRLLFYFSPILYGVNDVTESDRLGGRRGDLFLLNPLAGIFDLYRSPSSPTSGPAGTPVVSLRCCLGGVFALGVVVFRRLEGAVLKEI